MRLTRPHAAIVHLLDFVNRGFEAVFVRSEGQFQILTRPLQGRFGTELSWDKVTLLVSRILYRLGRRSLLKELFVVVGGGG